jgi:predicted enzyme related to lactoylglutathione lyase
VYFGAASTDDVVAAAVRAGGKVEHEPVDSPYGRMAMAADDQGARFSIISASAAG